MSKKIAISSIMTALCVVALFTGSILPITIAMCFLASAIGSVNILECGKKYALLSYVAVCIISFLFIPKKFIVYLYIFILGYYPLIKLFIEKFNNLLKEWILKILFFTILLIATYFVMQNFFLPSLDKKLVEFFFSHIATIIAISEVAFIVYDIGLTYFIDFYIRRIKRY